MRVLYVEDYAIQAQLVRDVLRRRAPQIQIEIASSLAQALTRLRLFEAGLRGHADGGTLAGAEAPMFDVLLVDLGLPDGSGLELLEHVRGRALPLAVVMLTGSDDDAAQVCLHAGADDFLSKQGPYLGSLPHTLLTALDGFRAGRRVGPPAQPPAPMPSAATG